MKRSILGCVSATIFLLAPAALAQGTTTGTSEEQLPVPPAPPAPPKPAPSAAPSASPSAAPSAADEVTDHEKVVGSLAVGYFGVSQIPLAPLAGTSPGSVTAPFIGVRYWLKRGIGLDVALGFMTQSGSTEVVAGNQSQSTDLPAVLAGGVKAGVPLALATGKHYTFTIIPELLVAGATRTVKQPNVPDVSLTGSRIAAGARAGAEIQFGFIGVPQLSLQATVGLSIDRVAMKRSQETPQGTQSSSGAAMQVATTVQSDPWALFTNNISALYYF